MSVELLSSPDKPQSPLLNALILAALAFLLTLFCLELIVFSGRISSLWFATALMTIVVFRSPPRHAPLLIAGCAAGTALANGLILGLDLANLKFTLVNVLQALVGGTLLRALLKPQAPLNSLRDWLRFVMLVGAIAPLMGGVLALWIMNISGSGIFSFFSTWVVSEIIGMLALGPVLLLMPWPLRPLTIRLRRLAEFLITLLLTAGASWFALRFMPWPFTFIVVILFWCAVRLPKRDAFLVFLLNACAISLTLALGLATLRTRGDLPGQVASWLPFLLVLIPSHIMALVMDAFRREKHHISESETRFRHAMEYSAIGMALVSPKGEWLQVNHSLCLTLGFPAAELKKLTFQQITHPDDLQNDLQHADRLLRGEVDAYTIEKRYFRKSGEIVWVRLTVSLVRDGAQQPLYFIAQIIDISELKQSEQVNRHLMERITLANEAGEIGVYEWNLTRNEMMWDRYMYRLFDLPAHQPPSRELWRSQVHPADRERLDRALQPSEKVDVFDIEYRILRVDGVRTLRTQARRFFNQDGRIERMLGICQDVTHLRNLTDALFEEKERMAITLDSIGEAVISTDSDMRVTFMNPVAEKMSGWRQEEAAGIPLSELLHITQGLHGEPVENQRLRHLPMEKVTPALDDELVLHAADGGVVAIHYSITPLRTLQGEEIGAVMVIQDVSESRRIMQRLSYSALHDTLTRLPNRASFDRHLQRLLGEAVTRGHQHVLAFIDLDKFKAVNDSAGHAAGDALLRELAELMQRHLRGADFLARIGGDEFALLMPECALSQGREVVQRIVSAVNHYAFSWQGSTHYVGASAGLTQIAADNGVGAEVLSQADIACYNAKKAGRGQLMVYMPPAR
ncbi:diguanylate cyclase [Pantoea sp. RRHST58]|uniref:diguanylate cyclase n=1 Tax=Pantoea sp. RRHST58 TaxID=3425183 RepID=UPI003DA1582F